jgi:hypothetical protein
VFVHARPSRLFAGDTIGHSRVPFNRAPRRAIDADGIFIFGDRLFLLDRFRGTQFREYRIKG